MAETIFVSSRDIPETDPAEYDGPPTAVSDEPPPPPTPPAEPATDAKPASKEYVRDGRRFVPKEAASEPAEAKKEEAAPEPAEPAAADDPAPTDAAPAATEPAAEPEDAPIVPYTFKAYGQEVRFPGAQYKPGHGVFIPEDNLTAFRVAVARAIKHDKLVHDNEHLRSELKRQTTAKELEAQAVLDVILPKLTSDEWVQQLVQNPDLARQQLALEFGRKQLEVQQRLLTDPALRATDPSLLERTTSPEDVLQELDVTLSELLQRDEFKGVFSRAEQADLQQAIADRQRAYVVAAPQDMPEIGVRKGELVIDQHALYRDLQREAKARAELRGAIRPNAVAQQNAQRTKPTVQAPPPAVASSTAKAGASAAKGDRVKAAGEPRWKSRKEFQAWLESGDL